MGRTACTEPQCLFKGALYFTTKFLAFLVATTVTVNVRVLVCLRVAFLKNPISVNLVQ